MEQNIQDFIRNHVSTISPKFKEMCETYFIATNSGKEEDYKKYSDLELEFEKIYTDKESFDKIKEFKNSEIKDPLLKRQVEYLFDQFQSKQIDEDKLKFVIELQNKIENKFSTFRAEIDGGKHTDNKIEEILSNSNDNEKVKKARLASKKIWKEVSEDVIQIVKKRNEIAKELWYDNYHTMSLNLSEQNPDEISKIFEELDTLTHESFIKEKEKIDEYLSEKFWIWKSDLMPRHYQNRYFQEAPKIYEINIDKYYEDQDIVEISKKYYNSLGLDVDSILKVSDLYEREGKYQHAYCMSDKSGTVRILCNIKPNQKRMNTQLHELWHAVYDKYLDPQTPYILYEPAHTFTTEAIAMMFGRFAANAQWIQDIIWISDEEKNQIADSCFSTIRLEQLITSRWMQVMYHFEKNMYANPDQDLNSLRRNLVEKYQMIKKPEWRDEPDRASKIHLACYPCYYHNYMLGEVLASQIYYHIVEKILKSSEYKFQSFYDKPEVWNYLKEKIFHAWAKYHWNTMIELATWEKLTAKYYAKQFIW